MDCGVFLVVFRDLPCTNVRDNAEHIRYRGLSRKVKLPHLKPTFGDLPLCCIATESASLTESSGPLRDADKCCVAYWHIIAHSRDIYLPKTKIYVP